MAVTIGAKSVPKEGDVVSEVFMSDFDNVLTVKFESGKSITSHVWHNDVDELRKIYKPDFNPKPYPDIPGEIDKEVYGFICEGFYRGKTMAEIKGKFENHDYTEKKISEIPGKLVLAGIVYEGGSGYVAESV